MYTTSDINLSTAKRSDAPNRDRGSFIHYDDCQFESTGKMSDQSKIDDHFNYLNCLALCEVLPRDRDNDPLNPQDETSRSTPSLSITTSLLKSVRSYSSEMGDTDAQFQNVDLPTRFFQVDEFKS